MANNNDDVGCCGLDEGDVDAPGRTGDEEDVDAPGRTDDVLFSARDSLRLLLRASFLALSATASAVCCGLDERDVDAPGRTGDEEDVDAPGRTI
jgi:hypothetical protein